MQTSTKIKGLQIDCGGEYLCHEFQTFLQKEGIHHKISTHTHTPQQNSASKRKNKNFLIWFVVCYNLLNYHHNFGRKQLAPLATFKIKDFIGLWGYKPFTKLTLLIFPILVVMAMPFCQMFKEIS